MAAAASAVPPAAPGDEAPAPLLVLTCMRSYSSLVSAMLGQHPGLYGLPEVNPFIAPTLGSAVDLLELVRKRTLDGLYRAVAELDFGGQGEAEVRAAQGWVAERRDWTPVRLMAHFAERVAPRRLIEKSPSTALDPDRIATAVRLFPQARLLHLVRHPVATCASIARIAAPGAGGRAARVRDPEDGWFGANRDIAEIGATLEADRYLAVRGEDLLTDPETFLGQVCEWLGLPMGEGELAAMLRPEESPFAHVGPPSAPFGNDPNFLRDPGFRPRPIRLPPLAAPLDWAEGRRLRPETVALAMQLGYGDAA